MISLKHALQLVFAFRFRRLMASFELEFRRPIVFGQSPPNITITSFDSLSFLWFSGLAVLKRDFGVGNF
jgi:hypothetical protein